MTWRREEEGMEVTVTLHQTTEKPLAPWDRAQGLWLLGTVTRDGTDQTSADDPDDDAFVFIRWDRRYVIGGGAIPHQTGVWHIDGHQPILTLLPDDASAASSQWTVTAEGDHMMWRRTTADGTEEIRTFQRTRRFPEN
jgi:hypothetical protein